MTEVKHDVRVYLSVKESIADPVLVNRELSTMRYDLL
jgi:hypothetical protein